MHYTNTLNFCQSVNILAMYQSLVQPQGYLPDSSIFSMEYQYKQNGVVQPGLQVATLNKSDFVSYMKQFQAYPGGAVVSIIEPTRIKFVFQPAAGGGI